jgi:poly-gamma-glutamate synthesis protein (capsule biosynthesis protein)
VVQAVELHHGRPIFFSLGNFAFDWEKMRHRALDGALVIAVLPTRPGEVADYTVVPVSRDEDNLIADVSSSPQESERILAPIHSGADAHLRQLLQGGDGRLRFVCD